MKNLLVVLLSFVLMSANAQTADEVIQKYNTAMGGLDAFTKITTAQMTGTLTSQGNKLPFITRLINGKSMRMDVQAMGKTVTNAYNNGTGWKINPYAGAVTATEVTGTELASFKTLSSLSNNLMDYKNRKHQVELQGEEIVDGVKTYKIKLTNSEDGKITTYFVNADNYMLVKSIAKREIAGIDYDAHSFYSDFKDINGLKFCMHFIVKIEEKVFQEVTYEKIELNVPVDQKIFIMPK